MPPKFQQPLYDHRLPREDCAADIQYGIRPGESWLIGYGEDEVWDHIMTPIENLQCQALRDHGRPDMVPLVPRYNAFLILLGMVRPMQVDGVWDRKGLLYNPYPANMLTRRQYYWMQRLVRTNVVSLLEDCNGQWAGAWCMGVGACGDELVVPHKGLLAGPLKMFIARKPHPTGIKLYCLADATWGYVVGMYFYTGARGTLRRYGTAAGNFDAKNIIKLWASLLPEGTVLCADSFFGSHGLAKELVASKPAFRMMTKRSMYGVTWAGEQPEEGQTAVCTVADLKYSLCVYKNTKVGHKPPRVVPMLTNVRFARKGPPHRRSGPKVHPVVAAYRTLSRGVGKVPPPRHLPLPLPHTSGLFAKSQLPASCERIHNRVPEHERTHRVGPCHVAANLPHLQGHLVHTIDTPQGVPPPPFFSFSKTTHMWVQKEKHSLPAGAWLPLCKPVYGNKVEVGVAQLSELNRLHTCIPSPSP